MYMFYPKVKSNGNVIWQSDRRFDLHISNGIRWQLVGSILVDIVFDPFTIITPPYKLVARPHLI